MMKALPTPGRDGVVGHCSYCDDTLPGEGVVKGTRVYCDEACAFEASRAVCGADCHCNVPEKPPLKA